MLNCCIERKRARATQKEDEEIETEIDLENETDNNSRNETTPESEEVTKRLDEGEACAREIPKEPKTAEPMETESESRSDREPVAVVGVKKKRSESSNKSADDDVSDDEFFECESGSDDDVSMPPSKVLREAIEAEIDDVTPTQDGGDASSNGSTEDQHKLTESAEKENTEISDTATLQSPTPSDASFKEAFDRQPEGRSHRCGELRLLGNEREFVWVPVTQDTAPMTEDSLEEHAEVLARWVPIRHSTDPTNAQNAHMRVRTPPEQK